MIDSIGNVINRFKPIKKTLKELIDILSPYDVSDINIIKQWFTMNDLEEEGLALITDLAHSKINKLDSSLVTIKSWDLTLINAASFSELGYDKEACSNLEYIQRCGLLNLDLKQYPGIYDWAKKIIPTLNVPKLFFIPTLKYLKKYDIYFKDTPKEKVDSYCADYEDAWTRED